MPRASVASSTDPQPHTLSLPMPLEPALDHLHARITTNRWLQRLTAFTRVMLAIGFIPPGMTKVLGHRFTIISPETSIGSFFEAFFQASEYYVFVGAAQVLAGLLLLIPRTAALGTVLYFPIILNIFVITMAMHFRGTWVITGMMLLATTYLLLWDFDKWKRLLFPGTTSVHQSAATLSWAQMLNACAYAAFLMSGLGFFFIARGLLPQRLMPLTLLGGGVAVGLGLAAWWLERRSTATPVSMPQ